jgi:transcriptional regulator with XRE-family HTH domain
MTSNSSLEPLNAEELADFGQARVRGLAFDAVRHLWRIRSASGLTQAQLAAKIGKDPAWVSRNMRGPRNWTFKTFGALVEALGGEVEIDAFRKEDTAPKSNNYRAYDDYPLRSPASAKIRITTAAASIRPVLPEVRLIPRPNGE